MGMPRWRGWRSTREAQRSNRCWLGSRGKKAPRDDAQVTFPSEVVSSRLPIRPRLPELHIDPIQRYCLTPCFHVESDYRFDGAWLSGR